MKSNLVKGAMFVTIATFFIKILSIVYKIPYQNITGDKGFYIYQQLYPFYALFVSLATFAFPLAISEKISQQKNVKKTLSSIFTLLIIMGLITSILVVIFNKHLGILFNDQLLSSLFYPIIPVLLLIPVNSVIRGFLYSHPHLMKKIGISQILEQIFRVSFILFILYQFYNHDINDLYDVARYSLLGFGFGMFVSTLYLLFHMNYQNISMKEVDLKYSIKLLNRGLFLLISSSVLIILQLIDSLTIIKTLSKSIDIEQAMTIKGIYDRGLPLIQTALFFVSPLLSSYLPHIHSKKEYGKLVNLIVLIALPASLGMIFVTKDLNELLFHDQQLSYVLQINSIIIFLYALFLTLSSIIKDTKKITIMIGVGCITKYVLNHIMISVYGIIGAPISSIISLFILILLILFLTNKDIHYQLRNLLKMIIASSIMAILLYANQYLNIIHSLIFKISLGMLTYFGTLFLLKINKKDIIIK